MNPQQNIQFIIELHGAIFGIIMLICLWVERPRYKTAGLVLIEAMLMHLVEVLSDILCLFYNGDSSTSGIALNHACNLTLYISQFALVAVMAAYVDALLRRNMISDGRKFIIPVHILATIGMAGALLTPFTGLYYYFDDQNFYHRGMFFPVCMGIGAVAMVIMIVMVLKYRKALGKGKVAILLFYLMVPAIGLAIQAFVEGFSFMNIGITIVVIGLFMENEISWRRERKNQEKILAQSQAYLLNSQIQPHFIFNALNTIQALIAEDPDTAEEAVTHFAKYLRKSLNLKVNESLIPIEEELDFVKNYLYLEKLRFGSQLNIKYVIDEDIEMKVPFLSIQPLVENAIRHGIRKKPGGGTVTISINKGRLWNTIQIIDDGAGFDIKTMYEKKEATSNGVGLKNVEERIRLLCNGMMNFRSEPGKGTIVTVYIPRE